MKHPAAVTACNLDLENLITDVNRSIATLAITTLLKVRNHILLRPRSIELWELCPCQPSLVVVLVDPVT